ncbi:hypothetical protein [Mycobacterium marinum]|uniref:hypothetical protein n=1 Tax=Mycobacterium marinum TaxID=1781 RepID=UPI00115F2751|nr:hypothetical protein [Mycobacterium marinum]
MTISSTAVGYRSWCGVGRHTQLRRRKSFHSIPNQRLPNGPSNVGTSTATERCVCSKAKQPGARATLVDVLLKAAGWRIEYALMKAGLIDTMTINGIVTDTALDEMITTFNVQSGA